MSDSTRALLAFVGWATGLVAGVLLAGFGTRWLLIRFALSSTWKEQTILWTVGAASAIGGFEAFIHATWAWVHWRRGWRVRWIADQCYAYEEFDDNGQVRFLEIRYEPLETRYAPPCRITVPDAAEWNTMTPIWAHGRRDAIVDRLRRWGSFEGWNAPVVFVAATHPRDESHV